MTTYCDRPKTDVNTTLELDIRHYLLHQHILVLYMYLGYSSYDDYMFGYSFTEISVLTTIVTLYMPIVV